MLYFDDETYFELRDRQNFLRLTPLSAGSGSDWIKVQLKVNGGNFSGTHDVEFISNEFLSLRDIFVRLYDDFKGSASFQHIDGYLEFKIDGDGLGHFEVETVAIYDNAVLEFKIGLDQSHYPQIISQLESIIKQIYS